MLQFENLGLTNEITQYKQAVDTLTSKLKTPSADHQGNRTKPVTNLVAQRWMTS